MGMTRNGEGENVQMREREISKYTMRIPTM